MLPSLSRVMLCCLFDLIRHLQANEALRKDGTSEMLVVLSPFLFFFFAKYFPFSDSASIDSQTQLQIVDVELGGALDCSWCAAGALSSRPGAATRTLRAIACSSVGITCSIEDCSCCS